MNCRHTDGIARLRAAHDALEEHTKETRRLLDERTPSGARLPRLPGFWPARDDIRTCLQQHVNEAVSRLLKVAP